MIRFATFTVPRVDREHLQQFVGKAVRIIGRLKEVRTVDYNQECVVEMYDGSLVNVVDGPVSCTYLRSRQTDNCGNYLVHWIVDSGNGAERRWRGCISIPPSSNILFLLHRCWFNIC